MKNKLGILAQVTATLVGSMAMFSVAAQSAFASVTVTPATGGSTLSADNAGSSGSYTTLTGPTIAENSVGDIGTGTIIFNAPSGFQFRTSSNSVTATRTTLGTCGGPGNSSVLLNGNSSQSVTPTASSITVTISQASKGNSNCKSTITWSGVQVRPTSGSPLASGNITNTGSSATISGITNSTNLGTLTEVVGALDHFAFNSIPSQTAGNAFNVTMTAQDASNNIITSYTGTADLTTTAGTISPTQSGAFSSGTRTQSVNVTEAGSGQTITATDHGGSASGTSSGFTVNAGSFTKLQLLVPGETAAPGTASGKTGAPSSQTVNSSFNVIVNAVDANWNSVSSTHTIGITSTDANATLPSNAALVSGTKTLSVTLKTAGTATVKATDISDGTKTSNTSPTITVVGLPDLTVGAVTPTTVTAGSSQTYVATITNGGSASTGASFTTLFQSASDSSGTGASDIGTDSDTTLGAGSTETTSLSYTATTAGTFYMRACADKNSANSNGVITESSESNNCGAWTAVTVNPGALDHFAFSSIPSQTAGTAFNVTMTAQDANNNTVTGYIGSVDLTTTAGIISPTQSSAFVAGVRTQSVSVTEAGSGQTITATDHGGSKKGTSGNFTVNAGSFSKLQLLVPGESAAPGTSSGKTGTPTAQTSTVSFSVTVNAVDANWNPLSSTDKIRITSSDAGATLPADANLSSGTKNFTVTLKAAGTATITASDTTNAGRTSNTSPSVTVNGLSNLTTGSVTPTSVTAGSAQTYSATITNSGIGTTGASFTTLFQSATDANGIGATDIGTDTDTTLGAASTETTTFSYTVKTAGTFYMRACADKSSSADSGVITESSESDNCGAWTAITVNPGSFSKLQLLVPGETAAPGTTGGKTGTPTTQTSLTPFTVTVNAVDSNWNAVSSSDIIQITSNDGSATLPANAALVAGTKTFSVTLKTVSSTATVTAKDVTSTGKTSNTSPSITVMSPVTTTSRLYPSSTGSYSDWLPNTGTALSAAGSIDSSDNTYIDTSAVPLTSTFNPANASTSQIPTGATVNSVTLFVVARGTGSGSTLQPVVEKDSSHVIVGPAWNLTTSYATSSYTFPTTGDGKAWTQTEVTNWTNSFGVRTTPVSALARVTQMYVVVNYSSTGASCQLGVDLSWNGASTTPSWTSEKSSSSLTGTNATYKLGNSGDKWGRTAWFPADFTNANFLARVHALNSGTSCQSANTDHLDWVRLNVFYTTTQARLATLTAADTAKVAGANIFTIYYNSSRSTTDEDFAAELASGNVPYAGHQNGADNDPYAQVLIGQTTTVSATAAVAPNTWSSSGNAFSSDNKYATNSTSGALQGYGNFPFTLPPAASVTGIEVDVEGNSTDSSGCSIGAEISSDGGATYTATGNTVSVTSTSDKTYKLYGASGSTATLWGRTWTSTDFDSGNIVIRLQDVRSNSCSSTAKLSVDQVKMKLTYSSVAENSDGDNFFIAPAATDIPGIFDYIGNTVCPAARPVVDVAPTVSNLIVITRVSNDNGTGSAVAPAFTNSVNSPIQASQVNAGTDAPGQTITIPPGQYNVTETPAAGYTEILGNGCYADNTNLIAAGETRVCIITNNDIPAPPLLLITPGSWQEVPTNL